MPESVYDTFKKHAKAGSDKQAAWEKMWKVPWPREMSSCLRAYGSSLLNAFLHILSDIYICFVFTKYNMIYYGLIWFYVVICKNSCNKSTIVFIYCL